MTAKTHQTADINLSHAIGFTQTNEGVSQTKRQTYKDQMDEQRRFESHEHGNLYGEPRRALAQEPVPDAAIQQFFWQAVIDSQGDLDAMGQGIYLYWDETGTIIDIAPVTQDAASLADLQAPTSVVLEDLAIPHAVAPFRYGGVQWLQWVEAKRLMDEVAPAARGWAKQMVPANR